MRKIQLLRIVVLFNLLIIFPLTIVHTTALPQEDQLNFTYYAGETLQTRKGNTSYIDEWDFKERESYVYDQESWEVYFSSSLNITTWYYVWWTEFDYDSWEYIDEYGYAFLAEDDPIYGSSSTNPEYWDYVDFEPIEVVNETFYTDFSADQIEEWLYWWEYNIYHPDTEEWIGTYWAFDWEIIVYDSPEHVGDLYYADYWITYEIIDESFFEIQTTGDWYNLTVSGNETWIYESEGILEYWYDYEATIDGYQVNLSLNSLDFDYLALVDSEVDFIESETFTEDYLWVYYWDLEVQAEEPIILNGSLYDIGDHIPEALLPNWMKSQEEYETNYFSDYMYSEGTFTSISTFQSHFHAFQTKTDPESYMIWENVEEGALFAYEEVVGNPKALDFKYEADEHDYTFEDIIKYRGYPEVYNEVSEFHYSWDEEVHGYIHSSYFSTDYDYVTEAVDEYNIDWEDPVPAYIVEFDFSEPITTEDGITLSWELFYGNFPVWWIEEDRYEYLLTLSNISYSYSMFLNPSTGESELSTTLDFGAIQSTELDFENLGLGIMQTTEVISTSPVNTSSSYISSQQIDHMNFEMGNASIASIDYQDSKSEYLLQTEAGTKSLPIGVEQLNLLHLKGESNRTLFSQTSEKIGTFLSDAYKNDDFEYIYDQYVLITSYSEWDGNSFTHDPTYAAVAALASEDGGTNTGSGIPGFDLFSTLIAVVFGVNYFKRRRT